MNLCMLLLIFGVIIAIITHIYLWKEQIRLNKYCNDKYYYNHKNKV